MKALAVVVLSVAAAAFAAPQKIGAGVALADATSITALYETPEKFVGKTIRIDGVVTAVCEEMGCWMAIGADARSEQVVRLKVGHEGGMTFPLSARGKSASAEGVFEKIAAADEESLRAAGEHAAAGAAAAFGKTYQIKATGAVIK
jgi:hypothetical protein